MFENIFNPNDIGQPNGNYFALPYTIDEAEIVLISVPWDVTTSYRAGTRKGPQAIIEASAQVDLFDLDVKDAWEIKIGTRPVDENWLAKSERLRRPAEEVIHHLENGGNEDDAEIKNALQAVNTESEKLYERVHLVSQQYLNQNKLVGLVGGEHSAPLGLIKALAEAHAGFGILHIDAHADLRKAYEGFEYSHASIMYNALHKFEGVGKLVQVGVRDLCEDEYQLAQTDPRIIQFNDYALKQGLFEGNTWAQQCADIIAQLPEKVYISFDIDGLLPEYCPNTGTPVPGGLSFHEAVFLIKRLKEIGKTIIGFDLCEVTPGKDNEWDANVGARILYKLCCYASKR